MQGDWQLTVGSQGDQPGQFNFPTGLALTPDDAFLLVADSHNQRVAVLRATDGAWVRAQTGPFGTLVWPRYVTVVPSTGEVLVSDIDLHQVVRFRSTDDDLVVGTLGTGQGGGPTELNDPMGMVVLESNVFPSVSLLICLLIYFC